MNSIIVVPGAALGLNQSMINDNISLINNASIMLTGFEVPLEIASYCLMLAKSKNITTILNPAPYFNIDHDTYKLVDYLTPNEHEASALTKIQVKSIDDARMAGRKICELGVGTSIITMGEKGVLCTRNVNDLKGIHIPSFKLKEKVIDRTQVILEIFSSRAISNEGKIQVELAALNFQKTRLVRSWTHLERQRGGSGFLGGPGERQIELDRR